jgi:hypothetical protein
VVAGDDVDLPTFGGESAVLDRHLGGEDRPEPGVIGIEAGKIGEHADLDDLVVGEGGRDRRRGYGKHSNE